MYAIDKVKKVMDTTWELGEEQAEQYAKEVLGTMPEGVTVEQVYICAHNLQSLGKAMEDALAHNQLDHTKQSLFVKGVDITRALA